MDQKKMIKVGALFALGVVMMFFPVPEGLTPVAWKMFVIYFVAILGLIIKPFPEPVVMFAAIGISALLLGNLSQILRGGFASSTTWLVFAAFTLSTAFSKTNLGRRIAYWLMYSIGHSTLGIGYVTAAIEIILAPATPANTARSGGIVFPILNSVAQTLGSEPGPTARKAGAYFMVNLWNVMKTSSYMFMTAMGANVVAVEVCKNVLGIDVDWTKWAIAASVPGLIMLVVIPFLVYLIFPPELKKIDGKAIAVAGLKALGPMSVREKILVCIFILSLLGWIFGSTLKIHAATVGICAMGACLVLSVIEWKDVLGSGGAWSTLSWFGGIIGLSSALTQTGFFKWLAATMGTFVPQAPGFTSLAIVVFLSVIVRYFFASGSAYVAAMMPVFLSVGAAAGAPAGGLLYLLLFSNSYGGMVTHYGGAAGPILYGAGYTDVKSWWIVGGIMALLSYGVHMTIGVLWLQMLGYY